MKKNNIYLLILISSISFNIKSKISTENIVDFIKNFSFEKIEIDNFEIKTGLDKKDRSKFQFLLSKLLENGINKGYLESEKLIKNGYSESKILIEKIKEYYSKSINNKSENIQSNN